MKRALTSLDIYVIVNEIQDLIGSFVDKIYQISRNEIVIKINNKNTNQKENIYVKNGEFLCITQKKFTTPKKPSTFAMTARKYLINGKISGISQLKFDRIIKLKISKKEGEYSLIFELFTNGNILLLNPNNKIILPLFVQRWAHRTLKPNETYIPPPTQENPFDLTLEKFTKIMKSSKKDVVRTLATYVNLGGSYAEEICSRADIDKNTKIIDLNSESTKKLYYELKKFLNLFKEKNLQPVYVKENNKIIDILPLKFQNYGNIDFIEIDNFNKGLEEFISIPKFLDKEKNVFQEKIQKLQRQLDKQQLIIEDYKNKIIEKKSEGDILYLNFQECKDILDDVSNVLELKDKKENIKEINQKSIVKEFSPTNNQLIVILKDENGKSNEVKLDFRKSVTENASKAYNESKKFQEKIKGANKALEDTKNKIKSLEINNKNKREEEKLQIKKRYWFEKYRWFISTEGNIIVAGKDAKSNELVVKKYLNEGDRYVHADIHGAPSCIVKGLNFKYEKIPISKKTIEEACIFAATYSKAWKQFSEAQVYWVLPEQVSKTPQSGEFLSKGSFVIRGKRNYMKCKIEAAIGEVDFEGEKRVMGGPLKSIKSRSNRYIVIKPGTIKKSTISKKLSYIFQTSTEEIDRVLPPGNVMIVDTIGIQI